MVVPLEQALLAAAGHIGYVYLHIVPLADAVESADALLQQVWIDGQIKQYQVAAELEVSAFAADFRTHQNTGGVFLAGKVRCRTITFQQTHMAMENATAHPNSETQVLLQCDRQRVMCTDQQRFALPLLAARSSEPVCQPAYTRVV